ncbi:MAG: glucose-6-phosphate dehydrogenase [Pedobacter sp.]|nr:MAG: glucose-6-phosphate dehydrogenase [Pedobacter sp.]
MSIHKKLVPAIFIIFGGTGDLNSRKIAPAIYNLFLDGLLPRDFSILATANQNLTLKEYLANIKDKLSRFSRRGSVDPKQWDLFAEHISYLEADAADLIAYEKISLHIEKHNRQWKASADVLFYLAVAPSLFPVIATNLSSTNLASDREHNRILIEKPFGNDLKTAMELNGLLSTIFHENQIYRLDHYLGKQGVQNLMTFRFADALTEQVWNRSNIQHVEISVSENLGVGQRGGYYDHSGAMRDMIQNHLLQLLCIVAMEPSLGHSSDAVRDSKVKVLKSIRKFDSDMLNKNLVRGQYSEGYEDGKKVNGYREELNVDPDSSTETFAAVKFFIDNQRWQGVPFILSTGKRMQQSASTITIQFKESLKPLFGIEQTIGQRSRLMISIQPEISVRLQIQPKHAEVGTKLNTIDIGLDRFDGKQVPEAYETLIRDAILGNQTLFMRADQIELAWETVMPILDYWKAQGNTGLINYPAGTTGPQVAPARHNEKRLAYCSESSVEHDNLQLWLHQILESCFIGHDYRPAFLRNKSVQ